MEVEPRVYLLKPRLYTLFGPNFTIPRTAGMLCLQPAPRLLRPTVRLTRQYKTRPTHSRYFAIQSHISLAIDKLTENQYPSDYKLAIMASSNAQQTPTSNHGADTVDRIPERWEQSGISILIVGAGVAGLMAALECWRQGHEVRIIEKSTTRLLSGKQIRNEVLLSLF
jgi:hypothetical protein